MGLPQSVYAFVRAFVENSLSLVRVRDWRWRRSAINLAHFSLSLTHLYFTKIIREEHAKFIVRCSAIFAITADVKVHELLLYCFYSTAPKKP